MFAVAETVSNADKRPSQERGVKTACRAVVLCRTIDALAQRLKSIFVPYFRFRASPDSGYELKTIPSCNSF